MSRNHRKRDHQEEPTPDLLLRFEQGEPEAYEILIERYRPELLRFIRSHVSPWLERHVSVDDLFQEAQLEALRSLPRFTYRRPLAFFLWLCGIARNVINAHARRLGRQPPVLSLQGPARGRSTSSVELVATLCGSGDSPSERLALKENLHLLAAGLEQVPGRRRQALILKHVEGLDNTDAASRLGLSVGAFKVLASRALGDLRDQLVELLGE
ncbi:MAG: sigma-70 family RNA polymerase sigma factor [Acidobacteriota bacterium]